MICGVKIKILKRDVNNILDDAFQAYHILLLIERICQAVNLPNPGDSQVPSLRCHIVIFHKFIFVHDRRNMIS